VFAKTVNRRQSLADRQGIPSIASELWHRNESMHCVRGGPAQQCPAAPRCAIVIRK
jgi:hypothetical protein